MAPDINTLTHSDPTVRTPSRSRQQQQQPPQSHSATASRRTSQIMGPPHAPASATRGPLPPSSEHAGVPLRHPRPLTAAELYLECEKEQEAVVNRLTRELTALRAQSASVASNASYSSNSTSASLLPVDITDPNPTHQISGATHPTPSRRHRSSSSYSTRSIPTSATSVSAMSNSTGHLSTQVHTGSTSAVQLNNISQASADRAAAATGGTAPTSGTLSRQPSVSASGTSTPARQSLDMTRHSTSIGGAPNSGTIFTIPHRPSLSRDPSFALPPPASHQTSTASSALPSPAQQSASQSVQSAMQHYADTAAYRTEMEIVKAENDVLRQRVRALEQALRNQRRSSSQSAHSATDPHRHSDLHRHSDTTRPPRSRDSLEAMRPMMISPSGAGQIAAWADGGIGGVAGPRERSESQSTTASSRRAIRGDEDEVRVGESASNVGIGR